MRTARLTLAIAAGLVLTGCFQSTTVMKINADGSGTLEETLLVTKAGLAQMQQLAALGGGKGAKAMSDPFSEEQARGVMAALGPGVTYLGSKPLQTADADGRVITYAFQDVRTLGASNVPGADSAVDSQDSHTMLFEMGRLPSGNAVLVIRVPEQKLGSREAGDSSVGIGGVPVDTLPQGLSLDQLAIIKQMFVGARLALAVEPNGRVVKSNSPFVEGQRVTLLSLDADQLMNNEAFFSKLGRASSFEDTKTMLKDAPGLKVALEPEITIEFTPTP